MDFDVREINTLIQALDAWERAATRDAMSTTLMGAIIMAGREGADQLIAESKAEMARAQLEQEDRKEETLLAKCLDYSQKYGYNCGNRSTCPGEECGKTVSHCRSQKQTLLHDP